VKARDIVVEEGEWRMAVKRMRDWRRKPPFMGDWEWMRYRRSFFGSVLGRFFWAALGASLVAGAMVEVAQALGLEGLRGGALFVADLFLCSAGGTVVADMILHHHSAVDRRRPLQVIGQPVWATWYFHFGFVAHRLPDEVFACFRHVDERTPDGGYRLSVSARIGDLQGAAAWMGRPGFGAGGGWPAVPSHFWVSDNTVGWEFRCGPRETIRRGWSFKFAFPWDWWYHQQRCRVGSRCLYCWVAETLAMSTGQRDSGGGSGRR